MGCVLSPHSFCFHWEDFLHQSNWEQAAANEMVHSQRENEGGQTTILGDGGAADSE